MRKKRMEVKICLNFEAIPPNHLLIILHEDECFFLYPSKGDVQARHNWVKLFLNVHSYFHTLLEDKCFFFISILRKMKYKQDIMDWNHFWRSILIFLHFKKMNVFTYVRRKETYKQGIMGWNNFWRSILIFLTVH